jgi:2-aminobenzoate-CoA ligase
MLDPSAYADSFARDNLPPVELWPVLEGIAELGYPRRMNAAVELLDRMVETGFAARPCIRSPQGEVWSYAELLDKANRIAAVLVKDMGVAPGNRVLLRAANTPMLAACWFAVLKAGAIAVTTMPLLRARELGYILDKARIGFALCDAALAGELTAAKAAQAPRALYFHTDAADGVEARMARHADAFANVIPSHDDVALIGFTSGTTGPAKATMHFHRDVVAICDLFPRSVLRPDAADIFTGTPPLGFTFGLGGLLLFPMRVGASTLLLDRATPDSLLDTVARDRVTTLFTAPTMYRAMTDLARHRDLSSLKSCVSAGEFLPAPILEGWRAATGLSIIDGLGSTELLHIFVAGGGAGAAVRPGATGKPIPGYRAMIFDDAMRPAPVGTVGRLGVRGPTGCRYLADPERQKNYVRDGWNLTGDAYRMDADGYFWFEARTDDMIISAGYNISGAEVEAVLLEHPAVRECAVIAAADPERGHIVKACIVLKDAAGAGDAMTKALQDFVKGQIAPYKYPRAIEYLTALPRTETGKVQRFVLRAQDQAKPADASR